MNIPTIFPYSLLILTFLIWDSCSGPMPPGEEGEDDTSPRQLLVMFWCPRPTSNDTCLKESTEMWRQLPTYSKEVQEAATAAIGGSIGGAIGGHAGATIGQISLIPFAPALLGEAGGALGGGVGGAILGGTGAQGAAIGGALGGNLGGKVGGLLLGGPGGGIGGFIGGGLGAGLGHYYLHNTTIDQVLDAINATITPINQIFGPTINATWNTFLTDVLLIGPEEDVFNVVAVLEDYEEDLIEGEGASDNDNSDVSKKLELQPLYSD